MKISDKIRGCVVGGAIGDAYGGPYEGSEPPARIDERAPWRLSDDTQLTLATCEAISRAEEVDPATIAERFKKWFLERRLQGLGASTLKALTELAYAGGHWALVGRKGEMAAGNGAAMRIAPLAFLLDPAETDDRRTIRDVARITHHHEEAYAGALAMLTAVWKAHDGTWIEGPEGIEQVAGLLPDCRVRDRLRELSRLDARVPLSDVASRFGSSGYVVESVSLAIRGAAQVASLGFRVMLEQLIACGGDTDTIASMAGQIAGTLIGYEGLPEAMKLRLPEAGMIESIVMEFCTWFERGSRKRG